MNARLYPMRPKQIKNQLSVTINGIVNITMACLALVLTWFKDNLLWWEHAGILIVVGASVYLLARAYFKPKFADTSLIIDAEGICTNKDFLNKLPNYAPIAWHEIDKIKITENLPQAMMSKPLAKLNPHLSKYNKTLIIHGIQKDKFGDIKKRLIIEDGVWQIDEVDELVRLFHSLGFPVCHIDNQDYIKAYVPMGVDLGKRAGHLAYSSFFLFVIMLGLVHFDKFITLEFGYIDKVFFGVAIVVFLMGAYYLYGENQALKGMISLILFVPMMTLFLFFATLFLSPLVAKTQTVDFEFRGGKWQTTYRQMPLEVSCHKNKDNIHADGKVNIMDTLGMIRMDLTQLEKLCKK